MESWTCLGVNFQNSGRGPASKVALVYSPLVSGSWSLSAEKSRTFNILSGEPSDLCCRCLLPMRAFLPSIGSPFLGLLVVRSAGWRLPETRVVESRRRNKVEIIVIAPLQSAEPEPDKIFSWQTVFWTRILPTNSKTFWLGGGGGKWKSILYRQWQVVWGEASDPVC